MGWMLPLAVFGALGCVVAIFARRYVTVRGPRLVECPETKQPAAVSVHAAKAAVTSQLSLSDCSRWPEKKSCGRECLAEISRAPADCLVRTIITRWYEGKSCAVCGKPIGHIEWFERNPGFIDGSARARPWPDMPTDELPQVLATGQPACFDCCVAETFRRERPELVLDNRWNR